MNILRILLTYIMRYPRLDYPFVAMNNHIRFNHTTVDGVRNDPMKSVFLSKDEATVKALISETLSCPDKILNHKENQRDKNVLQKRFAKAVGENGYGKPCFTVTVITRGERKRATLSPLIQRHDRTFIAASEASSNILQVGSLWSLANASKFWSYVVF